MTSGQKFKESLVKTTRAISGDETLKVGFDKHASITPQGIILSDVELENPKHWPLAEAKANRLAFSYRYGENNQLISVFEKTDQNFLNAMFVLEMALAESKGIRAFKGAEKAMQVLHESELDLFLQIPPTLAHQTFALSLLLRKREGEDITPIQLKFCQQMQPFMDAELVDWFHKSSFKTLDEKIKSYQHLQPIIKRLNQQQNYENKETEQQLEQGDMVEDVSQSGGDILGESTQLKQLKGEDIAKPFDDEQSDNGHTLLDTNQYLQKFYYQPKSDMEGYKIYTTEFDEEVEINNWVADHEKPALQTKYKNLAQQHKGLARKLSVVLQRKLMSSLREGWLLDQEEGVLDMAKLPSIISSQSVDVFKSAHHKNVMDTTITLLVDNSGSMRGKPIEMAALTADVLTRTFEKCGVKVEVLGYTTKSWKGGESRLKWVMDGRPEKPGRLNEILHIIYKPAHKAYKKCEHAFGYMLADDLLKENIDGEGLKWAVDRLRKRPQTRKILFVISDGAPVDYATDRHNKNGYLDQHLKEVISQVERDKTLELHAIGIGHDVDAYYQNAVVIENVESLAETLLSEMVKLFDKSLNTK
ncbi:MAG: hypothetical protein VX154_02595 [Pseudomonadota bacterium]|nr:hypothetical protein [Pseudomonadota bacterium]